MILNAIAALTLSTGAIFSHNAATLAQQGQMRPTSAVKAARVLDVRTGNYINNAVILIAGERIIEVGSNLTIPSGVQVTDLGNATVLPGLIDSHTHILQNYDGAIDEGENMVRTVVQLGNTKRALLGAKQARECLMAGITTVRDLGNSGWGGDVALRDAINSGWIVGSRVWASTRALSATGGQFSQQMSPETQKLMEQEYVVVNGVEEARKAVRQAFYDGADLIKVIVNTYPRILTVEEMKVIVEEAHRVRKKVAAHATDNESTRIAAAAGVDSIEHGYTIPDDVLKIMAEKNIYLVPTDGTPDTYKRVFARPGQDTSWMDSMVQRSGDRVRRAMKAGVKIAAGSDMYYNVPGKTRGEASLDVLMAYSLYQLSNIDVIRTATLHAGELIGPAMAVGVLERGRFADLIAFDGDPMTDIKELLRCKFVMKGGVVYKNELKK